MATAPLPLPLWAAGHSPPRQRDVISLIRRAAPASRPLDGAVRLPPNSSSPSVARGIVDRAMVGLPLETRDVAKVLVSELVTNAVRHARTEVALTATVHPGTVLVSVTDGSSARPIQQDLSDDAEAGRGLLLVDALADSWGWTMTPPGKSVWFELRTDR
ncbi:MAG TPA: ATP-binding protein [Frankiaceae bacterium]|nr:ATP-binding protein [Frankiaceae bacterium]